jgi:protein-histidine pros-kinase
VLAVVFGAGMAVSAWVSHELLQRNAKDEVLRNAGLMMEAALAVRGYTVKAGEASPGIAAGGKLPAADRACHAATETFNAIAGEVPRFHLQGSHPQSHQSAATAQSSGKPMG